MNTNRSFSLVWLVLLLASPDPCVPAAPSAVIARSLGSSSHAAARRPPAPIPVVFERSIDACGFVARAHGTELTLASTGASFALERDGRASTTVRMALEGANAPALPEGLERRDGVTNYLVGKPSEWRTNVETFGRVRYASVYSGIDLSFYGDGAALEYDFDVAPHADPSKVVLRFDGADDVFVDQEGALHVCAGGREMVHGAPRAFSGRKGGTEVSARYRLFADDRVGFDLGAYDTSQPLVIDPPLISSTYLGSTYDDYGSDIAVDSEGCLYVVGQAAAADFPTVGGPQETQNVSDAFVTKLDPTGTRIVYSARVGGMGYEFGYGVAVDATGAVYVAGTTGSRDFPLVNPADDTLGSLDGDGFAFKLAPSGDQLLYSTYLGGSGEDGAVDIAVDGHGNAVVVGTTASTDYPVERPIQAAYHGTSYEMFVTRLGPTGQVLASTYFGGSDQDQVTGVAIGPDGAPVVVCETLSPDFPLTSPLYGFPNGDSYDAAVFKLTPACDAVVYSTYLGGSSGDVARAVATDDASNAVVVGTTTSHDFPVVRPFQSSLIAGAAFITKLAPDGQSIDFSTYFTGYGNVQGAGVALDNEGTVFFSASVDAPNLPVVNAVQNHVHPGPTTDLYVGRLSADGSKLLFGTYFGGTDSESSGSCAAFGFGQVAVVGTTHSVDYPTRLPIMGNPDNGRPDALVARFDASSADVSVALDAAPYAASGGSYELRLTLANAGVDPAAGATLRVTVPDGLRFDSGTFDGGTCAADPATGDVVCAVASLPTGPGLHVALEFTTTGTPGTALAFSASVGTSTFDPNAGNNAATARATVAPPPTVSKVTAPDTRPFEVRVKGQNFEPGAYVFLGSDPNPWPSVVQKGTTKLTLGKGKALASRFPKGLPVTIRVVNPDGGSTTAEFTRR